MEIGGSQYASSLVATQSHARSVRRAREIPIGFRDPVQDTGASFSRSQPEPIKVGFGSDSVKLPGVAVATIKRNVRQAKELIPTLEESQARVRERVEEDEQRQDEQRPQPAQRLDLRSSQESAINSTRAFISSVNAAASEAQFRTGTGDQAPTHQLDIRIGNTQIPYDKPASGPSFNFLA